MDGDMNIDKAKATGIIKEGIKNFILVSIMFMSMVYAVIAIAYGYTCVSNGVDLTYGFIMGGTGAIALCIGLGILTYFASSSIVCVKRDMLEIFKILK